MIGAEIGFTVGMTLFAGREITNEDEIMQVKEQVGKMAKEIAEVLSKEYARTALDSISCQLATIYYLEPDDVEIVEEYC